MRKAAAVAVAIAGVGSAAYLMPQGVKPGASFDEFLRPSSVATLPTAKPTAVASTSNVPQSRTFSASQPLLNPVHTPGEANAPASSAQITSVPLAPTAASAAIAANQAAPARKLSSSRPADDDARSELVKDLQRELKRVGCYAGEVNGVWGPPVKSALTSFTERVNATLPLNEPDYILLTLVQGHGPQACGQTCPAGQGLNDAGKCMPRAILAQTNKRGGERVAPRHDDEVQARPKLVEARPAARPAPAQMPRTTNAWSTVVTTAPPQAPAPQARVVAQAPTPLPGRMSIGAPIDNAPPIAATITQSRTASEAKTPASARQGTIAALSAPTQSPTGATAGPSLEATAVAPKQPVQPQTSKKQVSRPSASEARSPAQAPTAAAVRRAPPARPVPPYAVGAVAMAAPRPSSYAPQPTRWTRTIFNDITRGR